MTRLAGYGVPNTAFLSKFGYCLTDEGIIPTAGLHSRYPPSTAAPICTVNELRDQYDPKPVGDVLRIKVLLADDHRLLVAGFCDVLKGYRIGVVKVAYSLDGLTDRFLEVKPDVLMTNVCFDSKGYGENELDMCEELLARDPSARIIVFNQFDDQYIIEHSYKLGVPVFVYKDESTEVLNEAISTAAQDEEYFSPEVARLLAWSVVKDRNPNRLLSESEIRAFNPATNDASMAEIVATMDLSTKTVSHLMKGVKAKLGAESQADITKLAVRHGITTTALKTKS